MTFAPVVSPYQPINGLTGLGLNNGALYIGADGSDPQVVPQQCYWDAAGTIPAPQPIPITGGYPMYLGSPARLYTGSIYSIRVRDASGVQVFYEAHAVPGANVASGIFATVAAAAASSIPGSVQSLGVTTLGYAAAGDGGGAYYTYSASMPSHPGRFQSVDGAWWELQPGPLGVNVKALGAKGDASTDDTTAIANTILVARVKPCLAVYAPAATYKVTQSLDFTYSTTGAKRLALIGDGSGKTTFDFSAMSEAFPAIDFTGNQLGVARGWTALSSSNLCLATTLFLAAKNSNNFSGNGVVLDDVNCFFPRSGYHANNFAGAVIASSDRSIVRNSAAYGPRGWVLSGYRPPSVQSKFQTHSTQIDWTQCEVTSVVGVGSVGAALITNGSLKLAGATYFALEPSGTTISPGIVQISLFGATDSNAHSLDGFLRTENQSGATGIAAIQMDVNCQGWDFWAELTVGAAGFVFAGPGTLGSSLLQVESDGALFKTGSGGSMLTIGTSSITSPGVPNNTSFGWRVWGAGITASALAAAGVKKWEVMRNDGTWTSSADEVTLGPVGFAPLRPGGFHNRFISNTAYTTAPAEQLMATFDIPAGLTGNDNLIGGVGAPGYEFFIDCVKTGGAAVNGRIRVEAVQGANVKDIVDTGAALAAGQHVTTINARIFSLSGYAAIQTKGMIIVGAVIAGHNYVNLGGFGFVGNLPITINLYWTNTVNTTFQVSQTEGRWA